MEFSATGYVYYGYIYCNFTETVTFSKVLDRAGFPSAHVLKN